MMLEHAFLSYITAIDTGIMNADDERDSSTIYPSRLKSIMHHLFSLTIHTCVDLTPLFSSFDFQSLKHLDLRVRGQFPHNTPPLLDLDIPWAGLISLSLFSTNNMDPCLIHPILIKCRKLRRFEWYGDLTDFSVSGSPFSDLPPYLEEVKLHSDGPGLDILIQTFSNLPIMVKMPVVEISAFHRLLYHQTPYRSVTHLSLTSTLFLILRSWRETLVSGDLTIEARTTDPLQTGGISCRTLKHLGISSPVALESLWKVFFAPVLEDLHISLEGLDFSLKFHPSCALKSLQCFELECRSNWNLRLSYAPWIGTNRYLGSAFMFALGLRCDRYDMTCSSSTIYCTKKRIFSILAWKKKSLNAE